MNHTNTSWKRRRASQHRSRSSQCSTDLDRRLSILYLVVVIFVFVFVFVVVHAADLDWHLLASLCRLCARPPELVPLRLAACVKYQSMEWADSRSRIRSMDFQLIMRRALQPAGAVSRAIWPDCLLHLGESWRPAQSVLQSGIQRS